MSSDDRHARVTFYTQESAEEALLAYQNMLLPGLSSWHEGLERCAASTEVQWAFRALDGRLASSNGYAQATLRDHR